MALKPAAEQRMSPGVGSLDASAGPIKPKASHVPWSKVGFTKNSVNPPCFDDFPGETMGFPLIYIDIVPSVVIQI